MKTVPFFCTLLYNDFGMNRKIKSIILVMVMIFVLIQHHNEYTIDRQSCITGSQAYKLSELVAERYEYINGLDVEDLKVELAYQLAKRSVVGIELKDSIGNGIIWKIYDDKVIIAANKHLLEKDVEAEIIFCNGDRTKAKILDYSQQYDIGFLIADTKDISKFAIREIYEAVPLMYNLEDKNETENFNNEMLEMDIIQLSRDLLYKGSISKVKFEPVFNTHVIETKCYSKAGMSGGGLFNMTGSFIGMISGGEVLEESEYREADITYSIPAWLIENELQLILEK